MSRKAGVTWVTANMDFPAISGSMPFVVIAAHVVHPRAGCFLPGSYPLAPSNSSRATPRSRSPQQNGQTSFDAWTFGDETDLASRTEDGGFFSSARGETVSSSLSFGRREKLTERSLHAGLRPLLRERCLRGRHHDRSLQA